MVSVYAAHLKGWSQALAMPPERREELAAAGTGAGSGLTKDYSLALRGIILQLHEDMKMADKKRRATHMDELERFQMEEAIRESEGKRESATPALATGAEAT
eukprot:5608304-Alexandrium_andersonii.AAC.1